MGLNVLDVVCLVILAFTIIRGAFRGLVREILGGVAVACAYVVAGLVYREVADTMAGVIISASARAGTAYALTFGVLVVIFALVGWFLESMIKRVPNLGPLNQAGGLVFGGVKGALLVCVILLCLRWFPDAGDTLDKSALAPVFAPFVDMLADQVDQVVEEKLPEAVAPLTGH
jgi:membrane protein required for colicin V production